MPKGLLSSLEFDTSQGHVPSVILAHGTIYAIAYQGPDDDGFIKTVSVSSNGVIGSVLDTLEFDADFANEPTMVLLSNGFIAIAYRGPGTDIWIATVSVDAGGNLALVDSFELDISSGNVNLFPFIIHISGTIYAISYNRFSGNGRIKTIDIGATGTIGAVVDTFTFSRKISQSSMLKISGDVWLIIHIGGVDDGWLETIEIDASGNIGAAIIDSLNFNANAFTPSIVPIAGTLYAFVYKSNSNGILETIDIQNNGNIAASVTDSLTYESSSGFDANIGLYDTNVFLITYDTAISGGTLKAKTVAIADDGTIGAVDDTATIAAFSSKQRQLETATSKIWIIVSQGSGSDGFIYTMAELALEVTTEPLADISLPTATGHGTIVDIGASSVTEHGHCWSTTIDPTTADSKTTNGAGSLGVFTSSITDLIIGEKYFVRAYATNTEGTVYGANVTSEQLLPGDITIKGELLHYVSKTGVERYLKGTPI